MTQIPPEGQITLPIAMLITWKHAIRLEAKGLRRSRGKSCTQMAREYLGIKRNVARSEVLDALTAHIEELKNDASQ